MVRMCTVSFLQISVRKLMSVVNPLVMLSHHSLSLTVICVTVDVRDNEGRLPLDILLEGIDNFFKRDYGFDIASYLLSCGYGDVEDRVKWLYKACRWGQLEVVKELVDTHDVDPKG